MMPKIGRHAKETIVASPPASKLARQTKREQAPALVRLKAHLVREVEVLFRYALSGL
jgi:hypothetical protein